MNTRLLGAAMLLLLGFVVWLVWTRDVQPPRTPDPSIDTPVASGSAATSSAPDPELAPEGLERRAANESLENPWVVRGEVMHGSVAPLPAASFTARMFSGSHPSEKPLRETTLISDADGAFEWAMPVPDGTVTLSFAQCRADTAIMSDPRTVLTREGPPQDLVVFAFLKDCEVAGTVTNQSHQPIAGAWVKDSSKGEPEPCDAAGHYRMVTSATYGDVTVIAGAPGHVLSSEHIKVRGRNAKVVVHFELKPAARLAGRITNEDAAPVPGASVCTFETFAAAVRTDADGRYELIQVNPALDQHTVIVRHDDYLMSQIRVTRQKIDEPCDVVMKRGALVSGQVFGVGDRALAGASVHLGDGVGYVGSPRAVSREDGTFEVRNVPGGENYMSISARGYAPDQRRVSVPEGKAEIRSILVRLQPGHFVAGKVVDRAGQGLHRVRVTPMRVTPMSPFGRPGKVGSETYTARDGSFRLADLPAGKINLDCFGMHSTRKEELGVEVDRADVTVVMDPPARLGGRVLDDATGRPLDRFSIRFVTPELRDGERQGFGYGVEWRKGLVFEGSDGYWSTDNERLEPGTVFGVEATAEGYGPVVVRRAHPQVNAAADALVLRLPPAARLTGRAVAHRSGAGIVGAQVAVFSADYPLAGRDPSSEAHLVCRTDEQGYFELASVPPGQLSLAFQHPDWPLTFDGPFEATPGTTTNRFLSVSAGATLAGTAFDLQGSPLPGVNVVRQIVKIQGLSVPHASAVTDALGRFRFPALPAAQYWLLASGLLPDGSTIVYSRDVDVAVGEDLDLQLQPAGRGALHVELLSEDGLASTFSVNIRRPAANERPFSCSVSGSPFVVRGLPAGELSVVVGHYSATTEVSGRSSVNLGADGTTPVQITMVTRRR